MSRSLQWGDVVVVCVCVCLAASTAVTMKRSSTKGNEQRATPTLKLLFIFALTFLLTLSRLLLPSLAVAVDVVVGSKILCKHSFFLRSLFPIAFAPLSLFFCSICASTLPVHACLSAVPHLADGWVGFVWVSGWLTAEGSAENGDGP